MVSDPFRSMEAQKRSDEEFDEYVCEMLSQHGYILNQMQATMQTLMAMMQSLEVTLNWKLHSVGESHGSPTTNTIVNNTLTDPKFSTAILEQGKAEEIIVVDRNINNDNSIVALYETTKKLQPINEDTVLHKGRKHRDTLCIILANDACEEPKTRLYNVVKADLRVLNGDAVFVRQGLHVKDGRKIDTLPVDDIIDIVNNNLFGAYLKANVSSVNDWRPPWCFARTSPIAIGRTEWHPPWNESTQKNSWMLHFFLYFVILQVRNLLRGKYCYVKNNSLGVFY
ncbi:putative vesicle-fusing ATPase [Helianthus annuus]|nr:putative vesicle-fusing ATPase [Helianthus annuus]KAJ0473760.1 putative vesicle-fusing ATPase [Helianthus annuus]KAJ0649336.1 putative vesicle-fusing ATPase [Helianthus annuus]KAJ0653137.1 putative vesicle-fusing ATPase [Helianthus annuus]